MAIIERLIDLVENTEPECFVNINTGYTYENEEGEPVANACEVSLLWYDQDYQLDVTAPLCSIRIPEDGKGYDIKTIDFGGTAVDWDYWFNVAGLTLDEEAALKALMEEKFCNYDIKADDVTINIEHY